MPFTHETDVDLEYRVEQWTDDGQKVFRSLSANCNVILGLAAYEKALTEYPGRKITLRIGIQVIRDSTRPRT
jgi:hypothetical protein